MTNAQKTILQMMDEKRLGAIPFRGKWIFPQEIRESEDLADRVLRDLIDAERRLLTGGRS